MRCLPKLLVIWGAVLPLMTYPWARGFSAQAGLLGSLPDSMSTFSSPRFLTPLLWPSGCGRWDSG